jgi:hypothetical protein
MRRFMLAGLVLIAIAGSGKAIAGGSDRVTARAEGKPGLNLLQQRLLSGTAALRFERSAAANQNAAVGTRRSTVHGGAGRTVPGCPTNGGRNIRVNQECQNLADPDLAGRGQAQNETSIAQDPNDPSRLVASSNDYIRGDGNCYTHYSTDRGRSWRDSTVPTSFTRGTNFTGGYARQYWQAGGDTSVAFDTKGNAYLSCQVFNRGNAVTQNPDESSAFYVFRSTGTSGASWNFPGRPVAEASDPTGAGAPFLDKQLMTVDDHEGSPFQDRIYVTWTLFEADGTTYIYGAYSSDYGEHFSAPKLVSGDSRLCPLTHGDPTPQGACNANQYSQPFTGPDGTLYVVWSNFNVSDVKPAEDEGSGDGDAGGEDLQAAPEGKDNRVQVLMARSTDGGNTFSAPVKVADYYDLPDCATYQQGLDPGRACVPEKNATANSIFRATNYPSGVADPRDPDRVAVTFGSYINRHSNERNGCVPQGHNPDTFQALYDGVKTAGACNNDIIVSVSGNGGQTFSGTTTDVRELPSVRRGDRGTDQFWQWAAVSRTGKLAVSYYDRAYGDDEATGFSDVSLSGSRNGRDFATERVTTGSMPPATQFGGLFFGDYSGLTADTDAHPYWMDTRDPELFACRDAAGDVTVPPRVCTQSAPNADPANDQNTYTRALAIPTP